MGQTYVDRPKSLADENEIKRRTAMLAKKHAAPLKQYVRRLRRRKIGEIPDFDPMDGGINARVMFLFEKPGPMTSKNGKRKGSGFISRNNNDETAKNTFEFMSRSGFGGNNRKSVCIWNVIPAWDGKIKFSKADIEAGAAELAPLIRLLSKLRVIVLVGKTAQSAKPQIQNLVHDRPIEIICSAHPSPKVKAIYPRFWNDIAPQWKKAFELARKERKRSSPKARQSGDR